MKILHPLLCYYPSQAGGPANTLYWLNNALSHKDFQSITISTKFGVSVDIENINFSEGQTVHFLETKGKNFISLGINSIKDIDIVQFSSLFFPPTLPILIAAIWKNKTVIISPRGELYDAAVSQKSFKKQLWIKIIQRLQKQINFHATNEYEEEIIQQYFPKARRIDVIPNYIELPLKLELDTKMQFIFLGRINPIKNIDILINSFANLKDLNPGKKMELQIVGSARLDYELEYLSNLKNQIKKLSLENSVQFMGHLDGKEKDKAIACSKALILPSKSENFGNVILEALAQGTPVIASKNTPWELLEDYKAGYWVDATTKCLTESMQTVINLDDETYKEMRKQAYALCKSQFDIQTNVHVWEDYYKSITNSA